MNTHIPRPINPAIFRDCIVCGKNFRIYRLYNICCSHRCSAARWMKAHRPEMREVDKLRWKKDPEHMKARKKRWYGRYREEVKQQARARREKNPSQVKAHNAVKQAIKVGLLVRPFECSQCKEKCKPHAHHYLGYEKENMLIVGWLCRSCHVSRHLSE